MTPEQILIDGLKEILCLEDTNRIVEIACLEIAADTLQEYNDAKAQEATVKENLTVQNLLTAHPLAEALRFLLRDSKRKDEFPAAVRNLTATQMSILQHAEEYYDRSVVRAKQALTQNEALIKQSEAVWAVVEAAKDYKNNHPHEAKRRCLFDMVRRLEALEMMEKGQ